MSGTEPRHRELVVYGGDPVPPPPLKPGALRSAARGLRTAAGKSPAKAVAALVALFLVASGVAATAATFNDEVKIGVNVAAGSLNINVDGSEGNPTPVVWTLPVSQFKPGDTTTKTVQVRNTGTLPAVVTTTMTGLGATSLGAQLDATLSATPSGSPAVTKSGKANGGANLAAFTVPGGGQVPLTVTFTLPASTDNTWQGKTDTLTLTLSAVQE